MKKRIRDAQELTQFEADIAAILAQEGGGLKTHEEFAALKRLESRRIMLLLEREETWRLKSRATWLESGDKNTKFFHAFAKGRKAANTVWILVDDLGNTQDTFDGMASLGVEHFKKLFKAPTHTTLVEIIRTAQMFLSFVGP